MTISKRLGLLALTASTLIASQPGHAEDMDKKAAHRSIYFRGAAGLESLQDMEYDINAGEVQTSYDKAPTYSFAIGYDFGEYDLELEYAYRTNTVEQHYLVGTKLPATGGDTTSSAVMFNAYYETPTDGRWVPYIGAGAGIAQVNLEQHSSGAITLVDDGDRVLAYQGMAGMQFNFTTQISAFAEYRYFATATVPVDTVTGTHHEVAYETHNVMAGLKYMFE